MDDAETELIPTIFERVYRPSPDALLYHYCGTEAYLAILASSSIRMSDINMMNDADEVRYGYRMFEQAATNLLKNPRSSVDGINIEFFDKVDEYLSPKQLHTHPVVACFSKDPEVLSQWRGYADDASGWCIGFSAAALSRMPVTLIEVLYDPAQQLQEATNTLAAIYLKNTHSEEPFGSGFAMDCLLFGSLLAGYKHPSFKEEAEVRALHELRVELSETSFKLTTGESDDDEAPVRSASFRSSNGSIVAYVDMPFSADGGQTISEVWLGPRNRNGWGNAMLPATHNGHTHVRLRQASSPYRG